MSKRWFLAQNEEYVCPLPEFKQRIAAGETDEFILEEEKRDYGGPMWCQLHGYFPETKWDCGINCSDYKPCNSRSGRCRELKNGFTGTGKYFRLTKNGLEELKQ